MEICTYPWIGKLIINISSLPNFIYGFNVLSINIQKNALVELDKMIWKFSWKYKGSRISKTLMKKDKVGELTLPNIKTYKDTLCMTISYSARVDKDFRGTK